MSAQRCPDGGTCHHECGNVCQRVRTCGPLSGVFPRDEWPDSVLKNHTRLDPAHIKLGTVVITGGVRRYCSMIRPPEQCGGLITAFEFTKSAGIRWCVDRPYGWIVPDDQLTTVERVRQVLYMRPDGFAEPWDHEGGYTDDEVAYLRRRRYEAALHAALVGWEEHERVMDENEAELDHWDIWLDLAARFDAEHVFTDAARDALHELLRDLPDLALEAATALRDDLLNRTRKAPE